MSITEILLILLVALLVLKPEDIPAILKNIRYIRRYFSRLHRDIMEQFEEPDDVNEVNKYLEKIVELEGKYEGEYSLSVIKPYYYKLLKSRARQNSKPINEQVSND